MSYGINLYGIKEDIENILLSFLAINSETGTDGEKRAAEFVLDYFRGIEYFKVHGEYFGAHPIPGDPLCRKVCWAMIRGQEAKTVVLLHHHDVVNVEDFKTLKHLAFDPQGLEKELFKMAEELHSEAKEDLLSGEYLFGRGTADMKAGGAIQMALLKRYAESKQLKGNVVLISLPDEENLSAGMRAAVTLLTELKIKFGLDYVYAINSEPHQRKNAQVGLLSEGSVGKMLAFVYVRGVLSHVGKVFEGFNPLAILTEIVGKTEMCSAFSDHVGKESAPPPTWLYLRDRKESYDVSIPLAAGGCVSILTLDSDPASIMEKLAEISTSAFETVIERMNESYEQFCEAAGRLCTGLPWRPSVSTYSRLFEEAYASYGDVFKQNYEAKLKEINRRINTGEIHRMEGSLLITEFIYDYINDLTPRVVIGFVPPYYPNVSNLILTEQDPATKNLAGILSAHAEAEFGQTYDREYYFTGISDLSYFSLKESRKIELALSGNMPLYGESYTIPLKEIEDLSMPCMNIGPWGKDFHKLTERVYKQDLYERTPALLDKAIQTILASEK